LLLTQLYLDSVVGKRSIKTLRTALKILPSGSDTYDYAYKNTIVRITGQLTRQKELAKQVLLWITCARRPLTTYELQNALAVEVGEPKLDQNNVSDIKGLVSVCTGLVTIDEECNVIRFGSLYNTEILRANAKSLVPNAKTDITAVCVTYLSFDVYKSGFANRTTNTRRGYSQIHFFEYAARNWGYHARKASTLSQALSPAAVSFLMSEDKTSTSSQGLLATKPYLSHSNYSQQVPRRITGLHLIAYFGVEAVVKLLLKNSKVDADSKVENSRRTLSFAAGNGHEAVVKLLLETGKVNVDSKDKYGQTPLLYAAGSGHEAVVKLLLENSKVEADSKDKDGRTPLSWAAGSGHEAVVKLLLENSKVEANSKDQYGRTPLWYAAWNGHEAVIKLLLEKGVRFAAKKLILAMHYGQSRENIFKWTTYW
jgi:hypothetical protein